MEHANYFHFPSDLKIGFCKDVKSYTLLQKEQTIFQLIPTGCLHLHLQQDVYPDIVVQATIR